MKESVRISIGRLAEAGMSGAPCLSRWEASFVKGLPGSASLRSMGAVQLTAALTCLTHWLCVWVHVQRVQDGMPRHHWAFYSGALFPLLMLSLAFYGTFIWMGGPRPRMFFSAGALIWLCAAAIVGVGALARSLGGGWSQVVLDLAGNAGRELGFVAIAVGVAGMICSLVYRRASSPSAADLP